MSGQSVKADGGVSACQSILTPIRFQSSLKGGVRQEESKGKYHE